MSSCLACGLSGSLYCTSCTSKLHSGTQSYVLGYIDSVHYRCVYNDKGIKHLIHSAKFLHKKDALCCIQHLFSSLLPKDCHQSNTTFVPQSWIKRYIFGKNFAEILSLPYTTNSMLQRSAWHIPQHKKTKHERYSTAGFRCVISNPPSTVYIIDDVMTTGATLNACAKALKETGYVKKVHAYVFAYNGHKSHIL